MSALGLIEDVQGVLNQISGIEKIADVIQEAQKALKPFIDWAVHGGDAPTEDEVKALIDILTKISTILDAKDAAIIAAVGAVLDSLVSFLDWLIPELQSVFTALGQGKNQGWQDPTIVFPQLLNSYIQ